MTDQLPPNTDANADTNPDTGCDSDQLRWSLYLLIVTAASGITFASILTTRPNLSANDRSRWCTVWSLAERGTYQIDEIVKDRDWKTIDKVRYEGHFYSSKPPMFPTIVAGLYRTVKFITGWSMQTPDGVDARVTRALLLLINFVPMLAALIVMTLIVERYARSDGAKIFIVFAAAFGTLLTPFLVTLNNHTVAASSVLFAVYPAMRIIIDGERRASLFAWSGFWAAFACCNELPAAAFGVAMFGMLFYADPKQTLKCFVPTALIPLATFFYTNYLVTGGWKPFYMYYGVEGGPYLYEFEGVKSYWMDPKGIDKGGDSPFVYFVNCTIGHHGIFSLSPIFLLTLATWLTPRQRPDRALRPFIWMGLALSVIVLAFYLTRTANYNYGGSTCGLRWAFWLIPLWLISMIPVLDRFWNRRWFQCTASLLLAISIFSAAYPSNPWRHPWLFNLMEQAGWIDFSD